MSLEKLSASVKELHPKVRGDFKNIDSDNNLIPADDVFTKIIPEHLSMDTVKEVQSLVSNFSHAAALSFGEESIDYLKKNKDVSNVSMKLKLGSDTLSCDFAREVDRRNPLTGETFKKYGVMTTKLVSGVGGNRGDYKKITEDLNGRAASVFAQ